MMCYYYILLPGTIQLSYRDGGRNGGHCYNHNSAKADTSAGAGDGCPISKNGEIV